MLKTADHEMLNEYAGQVQEALNDIFLHEDTFDKLLKMATLIREAFSRGNKLIIMGNGGSATDADHIASEFVGKFGQPKRQGYPAIALTNPAFLTAWANDFNYNTTFSRAVNAYIADGDVVWVLSTSGNSRNIITAIDYLRARQEKTFSVIGFLGYALRSPAMDNSYPGVDVNIRVPLYHPYMTSQEAEETMLTAIIQDVHRVLYHMIVMHVDMELATKS